MQHGNWEEYISLALARRRAPTHDKQMWADRMASEGEEQLKLAHSSDFHQLQMSGSEISAPIHEMNHNMPSDQDAILARWKEDLSILLNHQVLSPPVSYEAVVTHASEDGSILTSPPT